MILSLGISKKDPTSFLCIDLSVMPIKIRLKFIEIYFELFRKEITTNIDKFLYVEDADKQDFIKQCTYENLCKAIPLIPLKYALKRYKIENTRKIYSLPFSKVYKVIGKYSDENMRK